MDLDVKSFLAAKETVRIGEKSICSLVQDYLNKNKDNLEVELTEERFEGDKDGRINFFKFNVEFDDFSVNVRFIRIMNDWQYEIYSDQLEIMGLEPSREFAFNGRLTVEFICRRDGKYKHKKEIITVDSS